MYKLPSIITALASSVFALTLCSANAVAQTYNTDYISFEGTLVVLDNPTSAGCQADGINYNDQYRVSYRFTVNPSVIADALALFPSGDNATKMLSTQTSGSLNGSSTTEWIYINHYGNSTPGTPLASSSNLTISSGLGQPLSLATGNIKILGSINNFLAWSNCNIASVHAALVVIPQ
jgi:hypothetical protein